MFWNNFYITPQLLGKGTSSQVYLSYDLLKNSAPVAIKFFHQIPAEPAVVKSTQQEVEILKELSSVPNVIHLRDSFVSTQMGVRRDELAQRDVPVEVVQRCQVFELVEGSTLLETFHRMRINNLEPTGREFLVKILFYQISLIIHSVHLKNIAHLDIKLENIMCDLSTGDITLVDFGFSEKFSPEDRVKLKRRSGSPEYCAPEIFFTDCDYDGTKADIWSMGVLLYVLLAGRFPFEEEIKEETTSICDIPEWISADARDLLEAILKMDPYARPSVCDVLKHRWFDGLRKDSTPSERERTYITSLLKKTFSELVVAAKQAGCGSPKCADDRRKASRSRKFAPL